MAKGERRKAAREKDSNKKSGGGARPIAIGLVVLVAVIAVGWSALRSSGVLGNHGRPRNVLLITVDTTRADHLACYGSPTAKTPNMDRLARAGVRFARCNTCTPITLPSHSSIMTGLYPYAHGARLNGTGRLANSVDTLAEVLKAHGFRTRATVASFVLNKPFGIAQGFDVYHDVDPALSGNPLEAERYGDAVCNDAMQMLTELGSDPFFLWVHFYDPHHPYRSTQHPDPDSPLAYADEVTYMDGQIGRLLDKLASLGRDRDTLVVLVGDHGEGLNEHDELRHGYFLYDTVLHVPLLMRYPRLIPADQTILPQVRTIDIAPTICDVLGIQDGLKLAQGVSLLPLIKGEKDDLHLAAYSESLNAQIEYGLSMLRGWTKGDWKYILAPKPELYLLTSDPGETKNLLDQQAELAAEMRGEMRQLIEDAPPPPALNESTMALDADERARLESLGYVGGTTSEAEAELPELDRFEPQGGNPMDFAKYFREIGLDLPKLQMAKEYAQAEAMLHEMIAALPNASRLYIHLASCLQSEGKMDEAGAAFAKAAELSPNDPDIHRKYATFLATIGNYSQAIDEFKLVLQALPNDMLALMDAAQLHIAVKQFDEAETLLEVARKVDPQDARPLYCLGLLREQQGRPNEAIQFFSQALEINPHYAKCEADLRRVRQKLGL